ncbi:hypothetical protein DFR28_11054 [Arenicella xantha]|uniref:Uncharacterized protein n=1 Tax=Arenicella xantha TaxID=644221 RepID=A0A395JK60_9GAMM|nr:hypothetical protein DFR28_11054 [Arenicella xantha]
MSLIYKDKINCIIFKQFSESYCLRTVTVQSPLLLTELSTGSVGKFLA